jgi:hypothetical protein
MYKRILTAVAAERLLQVCGEAGNGRNESFNCSEVKAVL